MVNIILTMLIKTSFNILPRCIRTREFHVTIWQYLIRSALKGYSCHDVSPIGPACKIPSITEIHSACMQLKCSLEAG